MRGVFVLVITLIYIVVWTCEADKQAQLRRMPLRRRTRLGRLQLPGATNRERVIAGVRPGSGSAIAVLSSKRGEDVQADESSAPPVRAGAVQGKRAGGPHPRKPALLKDEARPGARVNVPRAPGGAGSPNLLASFAGINRVLVISAPHESDGYYRMMMSLLKPDVYCELAERHVHQVVMFHQEGEMGGKVRRITPEGKVMEEPLDTAIIPRLMSFLKMEKGKFGMVLLRKTLQVEERYPYPVRLEAMYEVIDQSPVRKMEKLRQKGFVQKCKGAGVEGQVEEGAGSVDTTVYRKPDRKENRPTTTTTTKPTTTTTKPTTTTNPTTTTKPTTTTTKPTTTTTKPTTTTNPTTTTKPTTTTTNPPTAKPTTTTEKPTTTTTTRPPIATTTRATTTRRTTTATTRRPTTTRPPTTTTTTTQRPPKAPITPHFAPAPKTDTYHNNRRDWERHYPPKTTPAGDEHTGKGGRAHSRKQTSLVPTTQKPSKAIPGKKKTGREQVLSNEYEEKYEPSSPIEHPPEETEANPDAVRSSKKGKAKHNNHDKKKNKKKNNKANRRDGKPGKEGKKKPKPSRDLEKEEYQKPTKKPLPPKGSLASFLEYFENKRRLLLITAPREESRMYAEQRDEYLEAVCEMAVRKISIITIFGSLTNSTMKIDHYQLETDKPMKALGQEDVMNQDLITELRKDFNLIHNDFYMALTDTDLGVRHFYEAPIAMKAVFDHIDAFPSRVGEMEQHRRDGVTCKKEDKPRSLENFLSRFRWRRRLFVISAPHDEEWAYQQQLHALSSQACNLGLRHISVLKLVGTETSDMGGVLELYPINGSATVEREGLSATLVRDIRNYLQVSPEYFSMLLVGKDGNVKVWYPSPMWSMATIYDLVDSMQLRRQEMAIQQSLGMHCPEDEYGGYGYHQHGYDHGYQDGYHQGYGY